MLDPGLYSARLSRRVSITSKSIELPFMVIIVRAAGAD